MHILKRYCPLYNGKTSRYFLPQQFFNIYGLDRKLKCRNLYDERCEEDVKKPFKYYCSYYCKANWLWFWFSNFTWEGMRMKRREYDKGICQICNEYVYKEEFECDHIIPVWMDYLIEHEDYAFWRMKDIKLTLGEFESKWFSAMTNFYLDPNNLRTLCKECHKKETNKNTKIRYHLYRKWRTSNKNQRVDNFITI